jgi:hypothetical protein
MKKLITVSAAVFIIAALGFLPSGESKLVGRWMIYGPDNMPANEYVDFKRGGMYDVTLPNGQIAEEGYYKLNNSTFYIKNAKPKVCGNDYWGVYKLTFYGKDSLSFAVINDSCTNRRNDIVGGNPGLKRDKKR